MKYKRFFAFGCSFTNFFWPTWPDIIEKDLGIPTENWGLSGQGNVGMMHRMIEADIKHKFTEEDLIIVVWSTWHREDRFLGSWTVNGNIFCDTDMYDKKFRKKFWHESNDIIKNTGAIISVNKMFPVSYQASLEGSFEADNKNIYSRSHIFKYFQPHLPKMDSFPWSYSNTFGEAVVNFDGALDHIDNHPDIAGHLDFVKNYVYKNLDLTMKQETIDYYSNLQQKVVDLGKQGITKKEIKQFHDMETFFDKHLGYKQKRFGL